MAYETFPGSLNQEPFKNMIQIIIFAEMQQFTASIDDFDGTQARLAIPRAIKKRFDASLE